MKSLIILFFSLSIASGYSFAGNGEGLEERERQLISYLNDLRKAKTDTEKEHANLVFKNYLFETIQKDGAFEYPFSSLRSVGIIKSPDNSFRLFNWNIEQDDFSNKYYCYILKFEERKKNYRVIELIDNSFNLPPQPEDYLDETKWYGALYYKIIPVERSGKTVYTLLGYDAGNMMSHTKIMDGITFSGSKVRIGVPFFKVKNEVHKRLFYEHSKKAVMSLNYDEARKKIIMDHLMPESPTMEGFKEFYVPDMSYDAFKYDGNKWILEEDIIALNKSGEAKKTIKSYDMNAKGEMVVTEKKAKWLDPSNENAPGGSNVHRASLPDEENNEKKTERPSEKAKDDFPKIRKGSHSQSAVVAPPKVKKKSIKNKKLKN